MSADLLFNISQTIAIIGWGLLIFIPGWKSASWIIRRLFIPLLLSLIYLVVFLVNIGPAEGGFSSLAEIRMLFNNDYLLLIGWVHYLAFDLFVGTWLLNHGRKHNYNRFLIIPCLLLTLFAGPIGFLVYFLIHLIKSEKLMKLG